MRCFRGGVTVLTGPREHCKNFLDAVTMANKRAPARKQGARARESPSGHTMSKLAEVWYGWEVTVGVVRYFSAARLRIGSWLNASSAPRWQMVLRFTRLPSLWLRVTGGCKGPCTMCPGVQPRVARASNHQSLRWTGIGWWPRWQQHQL